jgi:hypothetical protein
VEGGQQTVKEKGPIAQRRKARWRSRPCKALEHAHRTVQSAALTLLTGDGRWASSLFVPSSCALHGRGSECALFTMFVPAAPQLALGGWSFLLPPWRVGQSWPPISAAWSQLACFHLFWKCSSRCWGAAANRLMLCAAVRNFALLFALPSPMPSTPRPCFLPSRPIPSRRPCFALHLH